MLPRQSISKCHNHGQSLQLRMQAPAYNSFLQVMKHKYEAANSTPKWWRPEMIRTYLFIVASLDRKADLVPHALRGDFTETLRLLPVMAEELVKASIAPRRPLMRVRATRHPPHSRNDQPAWSPPATPPENGRFGNIVGLDSK
jgi:hypothetical protein